MSAVMSCQHLKERNLTRSALFTNLVIHVLNVILHSYFIRYFYLALLLERRTSPRPSQAPTTNHS